MNLYFLRHGDAHPPGSEEAVLTPEGIRVIRDMGKVMQVLGIKPDEILSSDLARARETAMIIKEQLKLPNDIQSCSPLTPPGSCDDLLTVLKESRKSSVLLVGHEPLLSQTISRLISGNEQSFITMKKGSLAKVFVAEYTRHIRGSLEWLLTPYVVFRILGP